MCNFNVKGILKGVIFSWLLTFLILFLVTALTYFTDISMKIVDILVFVSLGAGVLISSYFVSKSADSKKVYHGLLVGCGVFIVFIILSFFVNGKIIFNSHFVSNFLICTICGFAGSLLGK